MARIAILTPPPLKPSEPGLSGAAAAAELRRHSVDAISFDTAVDWLQHACQRDHLENLLHSQIEFSARHERSRFRRAIAAVTAVPSPLCRTETYSDRRRYSSMVSHVETVLELLARPYPWLTVGIATLTGKAADARAESAAWLTEFASHPGPYDDYVATRLIPWLVAEGITHIGFSVAFQQQAPVACRWATLLREALPNLPRILGGPFVSCLKAVQTPIAREPFVRFDQVLAGHGADLSALAVALGGVAEPCGPQPVLSVDLEHTRWQDYWAPVPIVPGALSRGCYWGHCTFCPEELQAKGNACDLAMLETWLEAVAARFPAGAMLHLTDAALPMTHLKVLAERIEAQRLPLKWHGFVRLEAELADPAFVAQLARGGCAMLQLGVESASAALLKRLGKGQTVERSTQVVQTLAAHGIRNQVYLLFGVPGETEADREATLQWVVAQAPAIHAINTALLNLPRQSLMHRFPERFGITELVPFSRATDLSLYEDFRCGSSHPRLEARRFLGQRFLKDPAVRAIGRDLRSTFKANHLCFL